MVSILAHGREIGNAIKGSHSREDPFDRGIVPQLHHGVERERERERQDCLRGGL